MLSLLPCTLDDEYKYSENGTFQELAGPTKCSPNDPDLIDFGTWFFSDDETVLYAQADDDEFIDTINIVSLSTTSFKFTKTETDSNEMAISEITYSAQ